MMLSVFDIFTIGIGPSSSHTVGPMRAARSFALRLRDEQLLASVAAIRTDLYGSLGATGKGHGSDRAVIVGLEGESPETVDPSTIAARAARARSDHSLSVLGTHDIAFAARHEPRFHGNMALPGHPNAIVFTALDGAGEVLMTRTYLSVGGGFIVDPELAGGPPSDEDAPRVPHPFRSGAELLGEARRSELSISQLMLENELSVRDAVAVDAGLARIWEAMQECVRLGCSHRGVLPGGLGVRRRAASLQRHLSSRRARSDPLSALDWVMLFAIAVGEENAAGGRVVTAPTNGAAGIIPAVLHYYARFVPDATESSIQRFLLTAAALGILFKEGASISGAEVGCQGEVGSACAMAAGALAEVLGGSPEQVENAAEIAMEHNLGLTCDPVRGMVQVPCIERNAIAAVKAISAARMALRGDGVHVVSLDAAIRTMRETGEDMKVKYKETARGGLAVNVVEC